MEKVVRDDEVVLWSGQPKINIISRDEKRSLFSLCFLAFLVPYFILQQLTILEELRIVLICALIFVLILFLIWAIIKRHNFFILTDQRLIRVIDYPYLTRVAQRELSDLKHYHYLLKNNGKGDIYLGPYEVTPLGALYEYEHGFTAGRAFNSAIWDYEKYLDMTLHFFSVEDLDEVIKIIKERTKAVNITEQPY